ncbi:TetR/AcrR family transcriptional regulator [Tomitella fengzijianii]|uniref:TetR family transcriptional regulator n=1 Tax=Tomitella fengzijianii TaxID=2597660 RepID=A0A516X4K7_9ACTN|nr:TetR/AcrR family transcriptional regulator [Tomitella fengzijianii]QDQ98015.1 TetR family transcriptional regulator [Tomitella fengzijianii]
MTGPDTAGASPAGPFPAASARDRILASVLGVIGVAGIPAVTNRRIALEAGVSLGSITYHFASRTDMLREALLRFVDEESRRLGDLAQTYGRRFADGAAPDLTEATKLVSEVAEGLAFTAEQVASFELYVQAGRDPALRDAAAACFSAYDGLAVTVLAALGLPDPEDLAPAVVGMITGLQLRRLATGEPGRRVGEALMLLLTT